MHSQTATSWRQTIFICIFSFTNWRANRTQPHRHAATVEIINTILIRVALVENQYWCTPCGPEGWLGRHVWPGVCVCLFRFLHFHINHFQFCATLPCTSSSVYEIFATKQAKTTQWRRVHRGKITTGLPKKQHLHYEVETVCVSSGVRAWVDRLVLYDQSLITHTET